MYRIFGNFLRKFRVSGNGFLSCSTSMFLDARSQKRFYSPGQDVLRAEESGAQVPVLPAGASGGGVRRPASDVAQGLQGLQQH